MIRWLLVASCVLFAACKGEKSPSGAAATAADAKAAPPTAAAPKPALGAAHDVGRGQQPGPRGQRDRGRTGGRGGEEGASVHGGSVAHSARPRQPPLRRGAWEGLR